MKFVIATKNKNKIKEIKEKYSDYTFLEIIPLTEFENLPDIVEDGTTFEENAVKKAKAYSAFTGLDVLSDDSGLEIDALDGAPGVYSARFSGEAADDEKNNDLVLAKLKNIPDDKRTARFVCAVAVARPDGQVFTAKGICEGRIISEKRGNNGFGYDPIFYLPGLEKTMAELSISEKNRISHRARALNKAREIIAKLAD